MTHVLSFTYGLSIADLGSFGHKFGGKSHEVLHRTPLKKTKRTDVKRSLQTSRRFIFVHDQQSQQLHLKKVDKTARH
jgi:hypothetical protein